MAGSRAWRKEEGIDSFRGVKDHLTWVNLLSFCKRWTASLKANCSQMPFISGCGGQMLIPPRLVICYIWIRSDRRFEWKAVAIKYTGQLLSLTGGPALNNV